jgi:hypothetical protein
MIHSRREPAILRFATYLSPSLYEVYEFICKYVGEQTGHDTQLEIGHSLDEFANGQAHIGFVCGLPDEIQLDSTIALPHGRILPWQ